MKLINKTPNNSGSSDIIVPIAVFSLMLAFCGLLVLSAHITGSHNRNSWNQYVGNQSNRTLTKGNLTSVTDLSYSRNGGHPSGNGVQLVVESEDGSVKRWEVWGNNLYKTLAPLKGKRVEVDSVMGGKVIYTIAGPDGTNLYRKISH